MNNMPILECSVRNCLHNVDSRCDLDSIKVEGKKATTPSSTDCGSFMERKEGTMTNSTGMPDMHCKVECEAEKCTYNSKHVCTANQIGIAGDGACTCKETECSTFNCGTEK